MANRVKPILIFLMLAYGIAAISALIMLLNCECLD